MHLELQWLSLRWAHMLLNFCSIFGHTDVIKYDFSYPKEVQVWCQFHRFSQGPNLPEHLPSLPLQAAHQELLFRLHPSKK